MTSSKNQQRFTSFKDLKHVSFLEEPSNHGTHEPAAPIKTYADAEDSDGCLLFQQAMEGVTPLKASSHGQYAGPAHGKSRSTGPSVDDAEQALHDLVRTGSGFVVALTSEYISGTGYGVPRQIVDQLHRGDYAIQAHINLHGLNVPQASTAFTHFLNEAITTGKRAVLIVHGRGRSSRDRPVLKTKVQQWLSESRWKKWLLAYASARPCDGGAGATYVLLRQRPCKNGSVKPHQGG